MVQSQRLSTCPLVQKVSASAPIGRGATGPGVATLQELLHDLGHALPKSHAKGVWDGVFGAETDTAVRDFQRRKGLAADGLVGPKTLGALDGLILANPLLELLNHAQYKADQVMDLGLPAERRGHAYW